MVSITSLPSFFRFTVKNPHPAPVLIFDREGSEVIIDLIFRGIDKEHYTVLPVRNELFYLSPQILLKILKRTSIRSFFSGKRLTSLFFHHYIASVIEYIDPTLVITYIDNDLTFQRLSKNYPRASFYAIQNGVRNKYDLQAGLGGGDGSTLKIEMPHFICFGRNDVDNYTRYGHTIAYPHCLGSLKGSYYRAVISKSPPPIDFDICFVSQYRPDVFINGSFPEFRVASVSLHTFLKTYIENHKSRACIALASSSDEEMKYYADLFGDLVTIIPQDPHDCFSTYRAMDRSEVVVTLSSTAALEAFGWGKKVLFCNYYADFEIADFYHSGICSTMKKDPCTFDSALSHLLSMENAEFLKQTSEMQRYMMAYDPDQPVHEFLKRVIAQSIAVKKN